MDSDYDYDFEDEPLSNQSQDEVRPYQPTLGKPAAKNAYLQHHEAEDDAYSEDYESDPEYKDDFEASKATCAKPAKALPKRVGEKTRSYRSAVKAPVVARRLPSTKSTATQRTSASQWEARLNALRSTPAKAHSYLVSLKKTNAELRSQLRSLNAKLNDIIENSPKRRPPSSVTGKARAKTEQLRIAEKQVEMYRQEAEVVKARLEQLMAPAYGLELKNEIKQKEERIKRLTRAINAKQKRRKPRERDLERLLVRQEAPDSVKQANDLTHNLTVYTEKVRELEREAERNAGLKEDLRGQEGVLTKRCGKLMDIAEHYQTDEVLTSQRRLEEVKARVDKFSRHVGIVQHASASKASILKTQEAELKKALDAYTSQRQQLIREMTQRQLKIEVLETDLEGELEYGKQSGFEDVLSRVHLAGRKASSSLPGRSIGKGYPLAYEAIVEVDESVQDSRSRLDLGDSGGHKSQGVFSRPVLDFKGNPKSFETSKSSRVDSQTSTKPQDKPAEPSKATLRKVEPVKPALPKTEGKADGPLKSEEKPKVIEQPVSLSKPNFSFKADPAPRVSALDSLIKTQSNPPAQEPADAVSTISIRNSRVRRVVSGTVQDSPVLPAADISRDQSRLLESPEKSVGESTDRLTTYSTSTYQPASAFYPPITTQSSARLGEHDKALALSQSTSSRNRSHLFQSDQASQGEGFRSLHKEGVGEALPESEFKPLQRDGMEDSSAQSAAFKPLPREVVQESAGDSAFRSLPREMQKESPADSGFRSLPREMLGESPAPSGFKPLPRDVLNDPPVDSAFKPLKPSISTDSPPKRDRSHLFEEKAAFVPMTSTHNTESSPHYEKPSQSLFSEKRVKPSEDRVSFTQTKELARKAEQSVFSLDLDDKESSTNFTDIQTKRRWPLSKRASHGPINRRVPFSPPPHGGL
jgi:hypothetical protein